MTYPLSIYCSGPNIHPLSDKINTYMETVYHFLTERQLLISPEKSTTTLFSPDPAETHHQPAIKINNKIIRLDRNPKFLGITFATKHNFSQHTKNMISKCKNKLNILKALAGSSWGQSKETIIATYKTAIRSTMEYAAPIWTPSISETDWGKLQSIQNKALRIATGCHTMASQTHLHQECKVLPVKEHCTLITKQYLAASHLPGHPGQKHLNRPPDRRNKKHSLLTHLPEINSLINEESMNTVKYKEIIKTIHTNEVANAVSNQQPNRVLNTNPPDINKSENTLNRRARSRLSQLRSGFSYLLNDYRHRLNNDILDECPLCKITPHNTQHLFECSANPTNLEVRDLWRKPTEVAEFLNLESEETNVRPQEE